jgi:2-polyprenyl-3-methyl-5-hydroxy-6-metoxy-1,4-benzoquinol methylase
MNIELDYIEANKELWNQRTDVHFTSDFYDVPTFIEGKNSLKEIELELLGDVNGKSILHLQCHFGQDTLSLARMGAKVTGIDLSDKSITKANELAKQLNLDAEFICSDIFELKKNLQRQFDIIFTSYGTIGWLPELKTWAKIISHYLKPGGEFIIAEFHPVMWMFDNDFKYLQYSYFNKETIIEEEEGTYADTSSPIKTTSYYWNHSLSDVINPLITESLEIEVFNEFDYSPYNCVRNMVQIAEGKYQLTGMEGKIPMVFALKARKIKI